MNIRFIHPRCLIFTEAKPRWISWHRGWINRIFTRKRAWNICFILCHVYKPIKNVEWVLYESYIPRPWNIRIVYSTTMEYTIYSIECLYGRYRINIYIAVRVRLPFCDRNENLSHVFLRKLYSFIGESYKVFIIWNTTKIRSLFPLKDRNLHPNCVIYEGICSCGERYIGETAKCIHLRTTEHENIKKISEPSKHLKGNRDHSFNWRILANAPREYAKRKILEALYIGRFKPGLNEQVNSRKLRLFIHGVT